MRTAVIGLGAMGLRHLQNVKTLGLPLAGVCDARPEALAKAGELGAAPELRFTDPAAMLKAARPECVIVATTAPGHGPLTILAAEAGAKAVLCEKPLAASLTECDAMIAACAASGTRLAVNHQMRYMEQYVKVKELIAADEIGALASVTVVSGNFGLAMNGSHYFEMFRWLTGEKPATVAAWLSKDRVPNPRGPQFDDGAGQIRVENPSGRRLYMEMGSDQGHGVRVIYAGRHGVLVADELAGRIEVLGRVAEHRALPTTRYGMPSATRVVPVAPADALAPSRSVLEALISGREVPTGEDGRSAVAVVAAAYRSHENGHATVAVSDEAASLERRFTFA